MLSMIAPHGGKLVDRVLTGDGLEEVLARSSALPTLVVPDDIAGDARNLARGVFSPLEGFVGKEQFESIVEGERLPDGTRFTIPIFLTVDDPSDVPEGGQVLLAAESDGETPIALMHVEDCRMQ